jgi:two-component system response regulator YesN
MASIELTDIVTRSHFARIEESFRRHFGLGIEMRGIDGRETRDLCSPDCQPEFCSLVQSSGAGAKRCKADRLRSLNVAIETGQPYISFCHAGIVNVCVPVMDGDTAIGGLFFGKCLWQKQSEEISEDILKRLKGLRVSSDRVLDSVESLPVVSGRKIHQAAEFLFILLYQVTELDPRVVTWRRQRTEQQSEIGEFIQQTKKKRDEISYPYEAERQLIGKVKIGDRTGAKEILNSLLGSIMFQNPGDMDILKARLVELLSILSRAAVEGGVEIHPLLEKNLDYINKVINIDSQQDICAWISNALNDFIDSVYASQDAVKITQIKPAVDFIEANYDQPLTLADVAKAAYLSISRLAHLFKEQMGVTIIDYLTDVRIGHAKLLLLSTAKSCSRICFEVGYNNQSYFTRTFKEMVGMTPRQFRESNRRDNGAKASRRRIQFAANSPDSPSPIHAAK